MKKNYGPRHHEILDAATLLFTQKGYENTTVNDILHQVDIGKGTFYHYFKSKEQVMEAVVQRMVAFVAETSQKHADNIQLTAHEKMKAIILSLNISQHPHGAMIQELHQPSNAKMHQNSIVETIRAVAPILANVIQQGISEGCYSTPYPQETIEIILAANQSLFDTGIFSWEPEEFATRAAAFVRVIELSLGAAQGSFAFICTALTLDQEGEHPNEG